MLNGRAPLVVLNVSARLGVLNDSTRLGVLNDSAPLGLLNDSARRGGLTHSARHGAFNLTEHLGLSSDNTPLPRSRQLSILRPYFDRVHSPLLVCPIHF